MSDMAQDVAQLLDHLEIRDPVSLGGLSMGGYVAWEFGLQCPGRLSKLMLFDTRAVADTEEVARGRQMMAAQVVGAGSKMAADSMVPKLMSESTQQEQPDLVNQVVEMILATDPNAIAATQRGMAVRKGLRRTARPSRYSHPGRLRRTRCDLHAGRNAGFRSVYARCQVRTHLGRWASCTARKTRCGKSCNS